MTFTNIAAEPMVLFYQINYTLTEVPQDAAYFHAQFRRVNPLPYKDVYTILDGVKGQGQYVGIHGLGRQQPRLVGEGEIKFYLDGDGQWPTICGTGTEDYFCSSYDFENQVTTSTKVYHALCRTLPGDPAQYALQVADALACIAGTSSAPCALSKTCASPSRRWAGARAGATCRCKTTSFDPTGIRRCPRALPRAARQGLPRGHLGGCVRRDHAQGVQSGEDVAIRTSPARPLRPMAR